MKAKRLISWLCALALTISAFAGLTVTASAENTAAKSVTVTLDAGDSTAKVTTTETDNVSGVLILAKYTGNALTSVTVSDPFTTPADTVNLKAAYAAGDNIYAWSSLTGEGGMVPYNVTIAPKTIPPSAVGTVAKVEITGDSTAPADLTATVSALDDSDFTDTTAFTYAWTKDGNPVAGETGATLTNAAAGSYTVTATYNGTGNYTGSITSASFTVSEPGDTREDIADLVHMYIDYTDVPEPARLTAIVDNGATGLENSEFIFTWYKDGTVIPDSNTRILEDAAAGSYTVSVTVKPDNTSYKGSSAQSAPSVVKKVYTITWVVEGTQYTTTVTDGDTPRESNEASRAADRAADAKETETDTFTFTGWLPDIVAATANATYTAQFSSAKRTYTVTYNKDGGTIADESNYTSYTCGTALTLPTPTKEGYTFSGWYTSDDFSGEAVTSIGTDAYGNKSFYAKWTQNAPDTYDITFALAGGSVNNSTDDVVVSTAADAMPQAPVPAREGYIFAGWTPELAKATEAVTYTATWKFETPSVSINYADEILTGFETGKTYTIKCDTVDIADQTKTYTPGVQNFSVTDYIGKTVKISVAADSANSILASDEQTLIVPSRPDAPTASDITVTQPHEINGKGTISGVTDAMEYKKNTEQTYTAGNGTNISADAGDKYYVRKKATNSSFASTDYEVPEIKEFSATKETIAADSITIDYIHETIGGFEAGKTYAITYADKDEPDTVAAADTSVSATDYIGKELTIVKKGNGTTTSDSDGYKLTVPARPTVPESIEISNATESVTLPAGYSYGSTEALGSATSAENAITVEPETSVYVQKNATATEFKSAVKKLTAPSRATAPEVAVSSYTAETLNTTAAIQYLDGENWVDCTADMNVSAFGYGTGETAKEVSFRTAATESNYASAAAAFTIPARPAAPTGLASTQESSSTASDGTITGVAETMEYKLVSANEWTSVTGTTVTGLAAGAYAVRLKAADNAFAGLEAHVDVTREGSHTIKFVDYDGKTLSSQVLENGATVTVPENPTREQDDQYTYTFNAWTPEVVATVAGDATYTATYTETPREYTVTLNLNNGTLKEGKNITSYTYSATDAVTLPVAADFDDYEGHTFAGWKNLAGDDVTEIAAGTTGNKTYNAQWTTNKYTIKWSINGVETPEEYDYHATPSYKGETPTKEGNAQYTYTFSGWDPAIGTVTANQTYTAQFTETVNKYTVTWYDEDGTTVLKTDQDVAYGTKPAYTGAAPTKASTDEFTYTFDKWTPEIGDDTIVDGNKKYTASYTATKRKYTITWIADGSTFTTTEVEYGTVPTAPDPAPTKADTDTHTYAFSKWAPDLVSVTGAATYKAEFTETPRTFTITYNIGGHGTAPTESLSYTYGTAIAALPTLTETGYTFNGWYTEDNGQGSKVESISATDYGNKTLYAYWTINSYDIIFNLNGGKIGDSAANVVVPTNYNAVPEKPADPTKDSTNEKTYTFKGWSAAQDGEVLTTLPAATEAAMYYAVYEEADRKYTVTFYDGETELTTLKKSVDYNTAMGTVTAPEKNGYRFIGWTETSGGTTAIDKFDEITITANKTYYAIYAETVTITVGGTAYTIDKGTTLADKDISDPSEGGKVFKGWKVEGAADSTAIATAALKAEIFSANATYVAVYDTLIAGNVTIKIGDNAATEGNTGDTLTADTSALDPSAASYTYQWQSTTVETPADTDWADIAGATAASHETTAAGKYRVKVTADETGKTGTLTSSVVTITTPEVTTYDVTAATGLENGSVGSISKAKAQEGDKVTFVATPASGYEVESVTVAYVPEDPTAEVIIPKEESEDETTGAVTFSFTMPASDVLISASFEEKSSTPTTTYTVTYKDGEETLKTETVAEGAAVPEYAPTKTDYTFAGWNETVPETVTENLTLTTKWESNFVSAVDGKVKAISVMGKDNSETAVDVSGKTYAELKIGGYKSLDIKSGSNSVGGNTQYADGVILASSGGDSPTALIAVDASTYKANAATNKITLSMTQTRTVGVNAKISIAKLTAAPSKDLGALTSADVAALTAGTATEIGNTGTASSTISYDIEDDIVALGESDTMLYYLVTVASGRETKLSNFAITETPVFTVTATVDENGSLTASAGGETITSSTKLEAGTEVTLTPTANDGYEFKEYAVTPSGLVITDNKFTMPSSNVTVKAIFEELTGEPATVKVVFKDEDSNAITGKEDIDVSGSFVADQKLSDIISADNIKTYKTTYQTAGSETGLYKVYTYKSGLDFEDTDVLAAGANTVTVTMKYEGEFYQWQDYNYNTALSGWSKTSSANRKVPTLVLGTENDYSTQYMRTTGEANGGGANSANEPKVSQSEYVLEFDMILNGNNDTNNAHGNITFKGTGSESALYMYQETAGVANETSDTEVTWTINNNSETQVKLGSVTWYHYKLEGATGGVRLTITNKETGAVVLQPTSYATGSSGLNGIAYSGGRYYSFLAIDNIKIYKPTTQTVTFTTAYNDTPTGGMTINVSDAFGNSKGTITTSTEEGSVGTASMNLLPGDYSYTVDSTTDYRAESGTFSVGDTALSVPAIALAENSGAAVDITVKYTTTGDETGVVKTGDALTKTYYQGGTVPADDLAAYKKAFKIDNDDGGATFTRYTYESGAVDTVLTDSGTEQTIYITVKGTVYYTYIDFEDSVQVFTSQKDGGGQGRQTLKIEDDTSTNKTKVVSWTPASNAGNGFACADYTIPTAVQSKQYAVVEFDCSVASRTKLLLRDSTSGYNGGNTTKGVTSTDGSIFLINVSGNNAMTIQGNNANSYRATWIHVKLIVDQTNKKLDYLVTDANGNEILKKETQDYSGSTATALVGTIEFLDAGSAAQTSYIDNIGIGAFDTKPTL